MALIKNGQPTNCTEFSHNCLATKELQQLLAIHQNFCLVARGITCFPIYTWETGCSTLPEQQLPQHRKKNIERSKVSPVTAPSTAWYKQLFCLSWCWTPISFAASTFFFFKEIPKSTLSLNELSYGEVEGRVIGETLHRDHGSNPAAFHVNDKNRQGSRQQHMARFTHFCEWRKP